MWRTLLAPMRDLEEKQNAGCVAEDGAWKEWKIN